MILAVYFLCFYIAGGLAISLAYHRGLTHRSFKMNKGIEYTLVCLGLPAGPPVQWAGNHRYHHQMADKPEDPHSPVQDGFWYAHVGWYIGTHKLLPCILYTLAGPFRTLLDGWIRPRVGRRFDHLAKDIAADPFYRALNRPWIYLLACWLHVLILVSAAVFLGGWRGLFIAWASYVFVYNVGDSIDSLTHLYGEKPYESEHEAGNSQMLGILAMGEGWHANHHQFPTSARFGILPRQFDWIWLVLKIFEALGLAWDLRQPSETDIQKYRKIKI